MAGAIMTPALLSTLRSTPHLPSSTFFVLAGATLSSLNLAHEISHVMKFALDRGIGCSDSKPTSNEKLMIARKMRETLIKLVPITGLPKSINAMSALKMATPSELLDNPLGFSPTGRSSELYDSPPSAVLHRGQEFFDGIYGKISRRVMGNMDRSGSEDLGLMARLMYGYALSNTSVLTAAETSFVLIAALIPQDVNPQLRGHLVGATNDSKSTVEEVKAVRDVVIKICEASGMTRLDENVPGGWGWREPVANL